MWDTIGQFFRAMAETLHLVSQRDTEKNSAAVQAAAKAKQEQGELDQTNKAVEQKNTDEIRNELSEN